MPISVIYQCVMLIYLANLCFAEWLNASKENLSDEDGDITYISPDLVQEPSGRSHAPCQQVRRCRDGQLAQSWGSPRISAQDCSHLPSRQDMSLKTRTLLP